MWQRPQTLYIAIAAGLLIAMIFGNVATIVTPGTDSEPLRYIAKLPYAILLITAAAACAVALFCWKKRSLQLRLAGFGAVLCLGLQVWLVVDQIKVLGMDGGTWFSPTALFPAVAVFFLVLAVRGIFADELLVRNSTRLRAAKRKTK